MARLTALIITEDDVFQKQCADALRSGALLVSVLDQRLANGASPDFIVVDGRGSHESALGTVERQRLASAGVAIFMVALKAEPDLILQAMRAGANEFVTWPPSDAAFAEAVARTAARRESSPAARPLATTLAFLGAKGWSRHDDHGGELRRGAGSVEQAAYRDCRPQGRPR